MIILLILATCTISFNCNHGCIILGSKFRNEGIHVIIHPAGQVVLDDHEHGGYHSVEVELRITVEEVAEDARPRRPQLLSSTSS